MIAAGFTGGEAEELRRAFGFKRSEARMRDIEVKLRRGMEHNGIAPDAQEQIINSITSFALYGFPESHAASFALLAYASAYLKCHYLAAFTAALLNNQPMGFYSPATIIKDAQRHGLKIKPIDVMKSEWLCTIEQYSVPSTLSEEVSSFGFPVSSAIHHGDTEAQRNNPDSVVSTLSNCHSERVPTEQLRHESRNPYPLHGSSSSEVSTRNSKPETRNCLRLGLRYTKGLREEAAQAMVRERQKRPFTSIEDLVQRVPELRRNELVLLAEI